MLGRARGLLRARASIRQPGVQQQWRETRLIRNYANGTALGGRTDRDTGHQEKDFAGKDTAQDAQKQRFESLGKLLSPEIDTTQDAQKQRTEPLAGKIRKIKSPSSASKASKTNDASQGSRKKRGNSAVKSKAPKPTKKRMHEDAMEYGIITTSRPHKTTIEDLAAKIEPISGFNVPGKIDRPAQLVLLVTPGLAQHALDSNAPRTVYERFQLPTSSGKQIESITAVVDRLPSPNEQEGVEGMAYMFLRDPVPSDANVHTPMSQSAQKPGTLKFRVTQRAARSPNVLFDCDLQLPLAQTIFTTGMASTMIRREYSYSGPQNSLELHKEEHLESKTLVLPDFPHSGFSRVCYAPLVPLTPFRRINYVMGNIIRKLSPHPSWDLLSPAGPYWQVVAHPHDATQNMSASQELEEAVSKYFEALDLTPEPVSVWALVAPPIENSPPGSEHMWISRRKLLLADSETISSSWDPSAYSAKSMGIEVSLAVRKLISRGGRLIKVLSGGGGWGKKAGLLSLDPDVEYSTRELRQDDGWEFDFDGIDEGSADANEAQKKQALGEIVKEGDNIMFLLAPKQKNLPWSLKEATEYAESSHDPASWKLDLTFGTIPSSIDAIPEKALSDSEPAAIEHYRKRFGMLSEGGLAVTRFDDCPRPFKTKLDVPFTRYKLILFEESTRQKVRASGPPSHRKFEEVSGPIKEAAEEFRHEIRGEEDMFEQWSKQDDIETTHSTAPEEQPGTAENTKPQ